MSASSPTITPHVERTPSRPGLGRGALAATGVALTAIGMLQRSRSGTALAAAGSGLAYATLTNGASLPAWLRSRLPRERGIHTRVVTILRPLDEVQSAWQRFASENQLDTIRQVHITPAPGDRGTEVRVEVAAQDGALGESLKWVRGHGSDGAAREHLRRFKQLLEAGEVATNDPQPRGSCVGGRVAA